MDADAMDDDPFEIYMVVRSIHGDYSIWPTIKPLPGGWSGVGVNGDKESCLNWIEANWTGPTIS